MPMPILRAAVLAALACHALLAHAEPGRRPYIVQLTDVPIASYNGGVAGLAPTRPQPGQRLALDSASVALYSGYLAQKKAQVKSAVAGAPVLHDYSVVLNGFSAMLTDDEVRRLQARPDVLRIDLDSPRSVDTITTPSFLGLDAPGGLWSQLGGVASAGEDVIIGIVDTGVWPEHPSFADRVDADGKPSFAASAPLAYGPPPARWRGQCQAGEGFSLAHCNNKLIGAQFFDATYRSVGLTSHWTEFRSPRDSVGGVAGDGGHGTHTASTAGGNANVDVVTGQVALGAMSGMAPRARIAAYKVCWTYVDPGTATGYRNSCYTGDSVAAIEKAVADGVHVINYSISGGLTLLDPVEQAFFNASNAGVLAVASAGNNGPGNQVAHISPWQATVGAATHDREFQADVILGNGQRYTGASMNPAALPSSPLVNADAAALPGANLQRVQLCYSAAFNGSQPVLDPAVVAGRIVVCNRGENDRVDKSRAVLEAGGIGMVLVDNGAGLVAESHSVPTVHVTATQGAAIRSYAATAGATAAMTRFVPGTTAAGAPIMAGFSSRGPNRYDPNVLKPDLAAPGVDVIAGVSPGLTPEQRDAVANGTLVPPYAFASYQGTSMAAPHVTGVAALLRQQHPDWSPAMIKSALMTTATMTLPDAQPGDLAGQLPFAQGAGHIHPNGAADPGLVYDITEQDYRRYMCGTGIASQCTSGQIPGYDLNLPSIAVANVLGSVTVRRTVTNVGAAPATYRAQASLPGFDVVVSPSTLDIAPGQSLPFTVTLTRTTAPSQAWQYGSLAWSSSTHTVRSPIVARAGQLVSAPAWLTSDRATGNKVMGISTGFNGRLSAAVAGMKAVTRTESSVAPAPDGSFDTLEQMRAACVAGGTGVHVTPLQFTGGTLAARFETFDRDTSGQGGDDLDLVLVDAAGTLVDWSANWGSDEAMTVVRPAAGRYRLCTLGYSTSDGQPATFGLHQVVLNAGDTGGNLKALVPQQVYGGGTASIPVSWSGLASGRRYLGAIDLLDGTGTLGSTTLLQVETNQPLPLKEPARRKDLRHSNR